jgi:hypothetical protein
MNPYAASIASNRIRIKKAHEPERRFRWQVIPATLTFFAALLPLAIAVVCVLGWIEYTHSDRYNPSQSWYWTIMELSLVPVSAGTVILFCLSGWSWTRRTPSQAIALLIAGCLLLVAGFIIRV